MMTYGFPFFYFYFLGGGDIKLFQMPVETEWHLIKESSFLISFYFVPFHKKQNISSSRKSHMKEKQGSELLLRAENPPLFTAFETTLHFSVSSSGQIGTPAADKGRCERANSRKTLGVITRTLNLREVSWICVNTDSRESAEVITKAPPPLHPPALPRTQTAPPRLTNKQIIKNVTRLIHKMDWFSPIITIKGGIVELLWFIMTHYGSWAVNKQLFFIYIYLVVQPQHIYSDKDLSSRSNH